MPWRDYRFNTREEGSAFVTTVVSRRAAGLRGIQTWDRCKRRKGFFGVMVLADDWAHADLAELAPSEEWRISPLCKCGKPRRYYGKIGGYGTQCDKCRDDANKKARARRRLRG